MIVIAMTGIIAARMIAAPIRMAADPSYLPLPRCSGKDQHSNATAFLPTGIKPVIVFVAGVDDRSRCWNSAT
jgi:hypothetical protein